MIIGSVLDWVGRGPGISNPIDGPAEQIYGAENILQQVEGVSMNHCRDVVTTLLRVRTCVLPQTTKQDKQGDLMEINRRMKCATM